MKQKYFLLLLIPLALLGSCNSLQPEFGLGTSYFPSAKYLRDGIVNKYYNHQTSTNGYDVTTQVEYTGYQVTSANELEITTYNPAMELTGIFRYQFENDKMKLVDRKEFYQGDTVFSEIKSPYAIDWAGQSAVYAYHKTTLRGQEIDTRQEQVASKDSVVEGRKAKVFYQKTRYKSRYKQDSAVFDLNFVRTYAQGIGLYSSEMSYERGTTRLELIEQIPFKEFQQRANHGVKRVGYIDPRSVLDQGSDFKLCDKQVKVADYYNGQDKRAQYVGGKKAIWELVNQHLDKSKLFNESGYLTLRFIVICEGEAGWFTMEEADLDFQPKRFHTETIQHFFEILYQHPNWKPCIIREEARDAYTYITFKLKDGEIIEILP